MTYRDFTFIIPAAGNSKRFKSKESKIFFKYKNKMLISHIIEKSLKFTKRVLIISNKKNYEGVKNICNFYKTLDIKILIQKKQKGMGDAVYLGLNNVKTKYACVIWSDQIYLSSTTIKKTIELFVKKKPVLCFPVYKKKFPYVYILKDLNGNFKDIIQTRETNKITKIGYSDCGFFVINSFIVQNRLKLLIKKNLITTNKTKEIDFLKSFKYLSKIGNILTLKAKNYKDTIGINYLKDVI